MVPHFGHVTEPKTVPVVVTSLLHACMPSIHVLLKLESPSSPHFLNQAPPRAQQLGLPDCLTVPHLGHVVTDPDTVVVT